MIIITGASRGIGKFLFDRYSQNKDVCGTYLTTVPKTLEQGNFFQVDVSSRESVECFFQTMNDKLVDIVLINCAGISYNCFTHKSEPEKWRRVVETNLIGTYHMIRFALPLMRCQNYGRIINFSSVIAQKGTPGVSAYAASKAGLWGLTRSLAQENGSKGITINNINLGYVQAGMGVEQVPKAFQNIIKEQIPSKEFCTLSDILKTVDYLIDTPYINGTSIDLNGGLI